MKKMKILSILLLSISFEAYAQNKINIVQDKPAANVKEIPTPEQQETLNEFKGTQFLQLDKLIIPSGLKNIEEEIRQNVVDTIIASKTHTQVFSETREAGYTSSYTKFYGLNIEMKEDEKDKDYENIHLFYYNWTTNSADKEIKRKISKFNLLNELRFAILELLNGADYVKEHYDNIQRQNFARIKSIRNNLLEKKRLESASRQKKKSN